MKNTQDKLVAVIMAGGVGTRFWPLSTPKRPKQFIQIFDERSLIQKSYDRIVNIIPPDQIFVLTNQNFTSLVKEQLPDIPSENIIGEPERKDTAAAICLGALVARRKADNPVMVILTADHLIEPVEVFQKTLLSAVKAARKTGALYTFGIKPDYPATGYGYLELGSKTEDDDGIEHFELLSFKEKPDRETAGKYLNSGRYLWNSGMFVWTADAICTEMERHIPEHVKHISAAVEKMNTGQWKAALESAFASLNKISIDFAVMEKAANVRSVAGIFSWNDVGGWLTMHEYLPKNEHENHIKGKIHTLDSSNNLVFCEDSEETVALIGCNDMVIVRAGDKTLVAPKDRVEDIKKIVENMLKNNK